MPPTTDRWFRVRAAPIYDTGLSRPARLLFALLCDYPGKNPDAWPGQEELMRALGYTSLLQVRRLVAELETAGVIEVRRVRRQAPNRYTVPGLNGDGTSVNGDGTSVNVHRTTMNGDGTSVNVHRTTMNGDGTSV